MLRGKSAYDWEEGRRGGVISGTLQYSYKKKLTKQHNSLSGFEFQSK